jgi:hypothetical protein
MSSRLRDLLSAGPGQQHAYKVGEHSPVIGLDQLAILGERGIGLPDWQLDIDDVGAGDPQHLARLGLRPNGAE